MRSTASHDHHGIAITIKAIASLYSLAVGGKKPFPPDEGRHEQQQARARQMKVGHQPIDRFECVGRIDKRIRKFPAGTHIALGIDARLQGPYHGSTDGDDTPTSPRGNA